MLSSALAENIREKKIIQVTSCWSETLLCTNTSLVGIFFPQQQRSLMRCLVRSLICVRTFNVGGCRARDSFVVSIRDLNLVWAATGSQWTDIRARRHIPDHRKRFHCALCAEPGVWKWKLGHERGTVMVRDGGRQGVQLIHKASQVAWWQ